VVPWRGAGWRVEQTPTADLVPGSSLPVCRAPGTVAAMQAGGIIAAVVAVAAVAAAAWPSIVEVGTAALGWVSTTLETLPEDQAMVMLAAATAGFTVLLQTVTPLNMMAGALFGVAKGTAVFTVGATLGTVVSYGIGKTLLRGWAKRQLESSESLKAIDEAVRVDGLKIIVLARLSPLAPFALLSYVLGATGVSLGEYAAGTFLGLLPGVALYCWIGISAKDAATADGDDLTSYLTLGFTIAASVAASALAKRALDSATANSGQPKKSSD